VVARSSQLESCTGSFFGLREFALAPLGLFEIEQQVDTILGRMTPLVQSKTYVFLRFAPIARGEMHLALHPIVMTPAMPFFYVGLDPYGESDAKTEESRDADHDYTVDRRKRIGTLWMPTAQARMHLCGAGWHPAADC
jgi:hypothetical protein